MSHDITSIAPNLWVINATFTSWGLKGSTRTTIIRLPQGLLVHSPAHLTAAQHAHLRTLGPVAYVVAPNAMHYLYFEEFLHNHPQAQGYVSAALVRKKPCFANYAPLSTLTPLIRPDVETIEFQGHAIGETVFFHKPSRTLLTADLLYNLQPEHGLFEKCFMHLLGAYGKQCVPCYHIVSIRNRPLLRAALRQITRWPFQRIIMAHGRIIESPDAPAIFQKVWAHI